LTGDYMVNSVISDSGPIIHLSEIKMIKCFSIFNTVYISREVYNEVKTGNLPGSNEIETEKFEILDLKTFQKDRIIYYYRKYQISTADGSVIVLAKDKGIDIALTDDLDLRDVLKSNKIRPVGSIGIIVRAYKYNKLSCSEAIKALDDLFKISSLYVTSKLIENVKYTLTEYDSKC
jgi:predicted nucleic acid-binding protein